METVKKTLAWLTGTWVGRYVLAMAVYRIYRRYWAPRKSIKGKTALVTGAGGAIGREICLELARRGANVVLWDLAEDAAQKVASEVGRQSPNVKVWTFAADVSKPQEVYAKAALVREQAGFVAILINNAGIVNGKSLLEVADERIVRTFEVNAMANFWTTRAFLPAMLERRDGHIVTVASAAGVIGVSGLVDYCASKFAAVGFHESMRAEMDKIGAPYIKTTVICPSHVDTPLFKGFQPATFTQSLTPEYTAYEIVKGMQTDERMVALPEMFRFSTFLKGVLPIPLLEQVLAVTGVHKGMDRFSGLSK